MKGGIVMTYSEAQAKLGTRDRRKLGNHTYLERRGADAIAVKFHRTDVLTFHADGRTVYQSGGWRTLTTKDRMREYGPLEVFAEKGVWYVYRKGDFDTRWVYEEGLTVYADGRIEGAGSPPDMKLKRAVSRYAKGFVEALEHGKVPAPSGGDCWYCLMREVESKRPLGECNGDKGHILSHLEEGYYVPSLAVRAMEVIPVSPACRMYFEARVTGQEAGWIAAVGKEQLTRAIRRYVGRQLGFAV